MGLWGRRFCSVNSHANRFKTPFSHSLLRCTDTFFREEASEAAVASVDLGRQRCDQAQPTYAKRGSNVTQICNGNSDVRMLRLSSCQAVVWDSGARLSIRVSGGCVWDRLWGQRAAWEGIPLLPSKAFQRFDNKARKTAGMPELPGSEHQK